MAGPGLLRRRGSQDRLDPVRWRRPDRVTLLRWAAVVVLVAVAAVLTCTG